MVSLHRNSNASIQKKTNNRSKNIRAKPSKNSYHKELTQITFQSNSTIFKERQSNVLKCKTVKACECTLHLVAIFIASEGRRSILILSVTSPSYSKK